MGLAKIAGKKLAEKATEGALESVAKKTRAIGKKSDVIPPPFERAPAKTKEEIDAIARRVAPQLTGEFVRLDPTKSVNPAGLSKKRFDIEKELEHDIRPVKEVAQPSMFDYESNLGKVQLGVFGDPTIAQQDIYSIAGRELPIPSRQYGGPRYPMYEPEDAWASNFGAASGVQSAAERASKQYGGADVVGLYTKMGKDSYFYAQHLSDALMKNIMVSLPDMNKKQIAGFNKMVRNNPDAKDFAGIENPDIALAQMEKNPEMRKQFAMLASTPTYTRAFNMPNGLDVVHAVLEPDLRNLERGITGYTAIELDPNVTHLHATDRASTTTYDTRIPRKKGAEVQQLEVLAPYDLQYPDQLLAISKNPKQAPQPFGTLMMSGARQIIDPQHIDEMGLYREFIKKYTGKKKGGEVHPDGSARLANGASARKTVEYLLKGQEDYAGGGLAKKIVKHLIPEPKQPFIGYIKKSGDHESYSHDAAKAVDYHHSHLMKDPDAMFADDALTFVRYQGEPIFTIKGESVLDPYHPESAKHISTLAELLKRNGADPNTPLRIEDLALPREQAPYQGKQIGTLQDWIDMPKNKYAGGGLAKKIAKKLVQELPEASASGKTPIATTVGTYRKASPILLEDIKDVNAPVLDYGAGMGLGAEELRKTFPNVKTLEPFYEGNFDFTDPSKVPSGEFKGLTNFSVLNAVTPEVRDSIVENIGRVMDRGGVGLITARSPSAVMSTKGKLVDEPNAMITQKGTYQKGFDTEELREYIKYILGGDFEYEPLKGLSGTSVKIKKKADGGSIDEPETLKEVPRTGKISGKIADVLRPASQFLEKYEIIPQIPLIGGTDLAELTGVKGVQTLAEDMSYGYKPIRNLERGKLQSSYFDPRLADAVDLGTTALGGVGLAKNLGKTAIREGMKQIETGTGMLGRNVINPRMNIIKDPGGMLVGGEKALDDELIAMKKNEARYPHAHQYFVPEGERDALKDPNAVALNNWVDTKVRKYLRNQAGTEADPILKTIESGVEHNFQPTMGDTKYYVANQRQKVGKPKEGIAKTELGKEFEYKIDSMFSPHSSEEVKAILNDPLPFADPNTAERFRASKLRTEHDLPIQNEKDVEALRLLNEIPDKNIYTLSGTNITDRLGLNHVSDVLMEDLQTGRLRPEQLNQMSIEKAIRRTAEYDAEKAKAMTKAHATSIEGMPIPKEYNDGYKWVELKHETDPKKTAAALKSEGEMMGHCVGGYCGNVESGEIKIFSLRGPDGKSHVTIEARPRFNAQQWYEANADLINSDPYLKEIEPNVALGDIDAKYGNNPSSDSDYIRIMTKEMKKKGINPVEPSAYMELHQVKGKQNKRPDDKYQSYISDFIKNNPTKHEIVDVFELDNTNLMGAQNIADTGLVSKKIHNHPDVEKIVKNYPKENLMAIYRKGNVSRSPIEISEDIKYNIFKEAATDLARQGKTFLDEDDILNHLREKYLLPKKKSGGSINLNQEYKLENLRRRYG